MFRRDGRSVGWGVVALILVLDGISHAHPGKIWPRIQGDGIAPVAEGWGVVILGLREAAAGIYLAYRLLSSRE